jgi:hypothetical protein
MRVWVCGVVTSPNMRKLLRIDPRAFSGDISCGYRLEIAARHFLCFW